MAINTLAGLMGLCARKYGKKLALAFKGQDFSFADLEFLSNKLGNSLKGLGISKGDRVSIYSQNRWEWIVAYYAILKIGAVVNPVNVMLTPEEVLYVVDDCGAKALFTSQDKLQNVLAISDKATSLEKVIVFGSDDVGSAASFNRLLNTIGDQLTPEDIAPEDPSTIGYTSGTTGHPKGAVLTHRGVLLNSKLTANMHMKNIADIVVTSLPTAHVYGNVVMNGTFLTGGTLVLIERFNEEAIFEAITRYKATVFEGVPSMYMMLLNHSGMDKCDMSRLEKCTVGGQTFSVRVMQEVEARFGCPLIELWGMTEIAGLGTTHPLLGENRHGSIGIALPYCSTQIVKVGEPKDVLGPDEPGELMIRGPILMKAYYGNEKATREAIEPDGWLHTGDVATVDSDGYLYIVDRCKDVILTGGYNVYPAEIDRVISLHPKVAMVAVGVVPDAIKGELAKAYIVLKQGTTATEHEIISFCRERLAAYKVPRMVKFVPDLPKTSTGKIMRRALKTLDAD